MNPKWWHGRRVLVTGHTGFKGSWLTFWLAEMGAEVAGLGLAPASAPSLFDLLDIEGRCQSRIGDINEPGALNEIMRQFAPDVVIHMAAQALVRSSYADPIGTYETNVVGTVRLLEAVRRVASVKAVVVVTSDKCYENVEQIWGYREDDRLGGHDPYSSSKGAAEIAARSMQKSYFFPYAPEGHPARIATVRAGNVIGGGDWSEGRLVPDIVRGCLGPSGQVKLRNPGAVRPWQHVLDALNAYLEIAERLVDSPDGFDEAWNIGPAAEDVRDVAGVARSLVEALQTGEVVIEPSVANLHEASLLVLDCTKARRQLGWRPALQFDQCLEWTADWYGAWKRGLNMVEKTREQLRAFQQIAAK